MRAWVVGLGIETRLLVSRVHGSRQNGFPGGVAASGRKQDSRLKYFLLPTLNLEPYMPHPKFATCAVQDVVSDTINNTALVVKADGTT